MARLDAVALDLDGTLLEPGGRILPDTLDLLRQAADQGVRVLLATGRPPRDIASLSARTGLAALGLPHAAVANERDLLLFQGDAWVEVQPRNALRQDREYLLTVELRPALEALGAELAAIDPAYTIWNEEQSRDRGFTELHFQTPELARLAARHVRGRILDGHPARPHIICNRTLFAVRHADSGKGPNLAELCQLMGLSPRRVLAIGDAENDRSMLDGAWGFEGGAPGNAEPPIADIVRQAGGRVAAGARGVGVAELLAPYLD